MSFFLFKKNAISSFTQNKILNNWTFKVWDATLNYWTKKPLIHFRLSLEKYNCFSRQWRMKNKQLILSYHFLIQNLTILLCVSQGKGKKINDTVVLVLYPCELFFHAIIYLEYLTEIKIKNNRMFNYNSFPPI